MIRTHRRRGYRFVATVEVQGSPNRVAAGPPSRADEHRTLFVGRGEELSWLRDRVREARAGAPSVVLVRGEPGSGKTRLVEELLAREMPDPTTPIGRGRCQPEGSVPYQPFAEAISGWLLRADSASERPLADEEPALRDLLHPGAVRERARLGLPVESGRARQEFFSSITRALLRLSRHQPLVLWIDDLHAADGPTHALFSHLASALSDAERPCPVLLIATERLAEGGTEEPERTSPLAQEASCRVLSLEGLPLADLAELLESVRVRGLSVSAIQRLRDATAGNPLFLLTLVREAEERGERLDELLTSEERSLAGTVQGAVAAQVARMTGDCRSVLVTAAFIGERFGLLSLAAATGEEESRVAALLADAVGHGLVFAEGRAYRFEHPLVRQVLLALPAGSEREAIHLRIADVLEDLYAGRGGEHALEIAHHLLLAGGTIEPTRLLRYARRAGDHAFALCAWEAAARYYRAALASGAALPLSERAALHLRAGVAANHALDPACTDSYESAAGAYERVGDLAGVAWARMYLARARFTLGPVAAGSSEDVKALEALADQLADAQPALRGLLLETVAEAHWAVGDADAAARQATRAKAIGRVLDDDVLSHHASMGLALAHFSRLEIEEAIREWRSALDHARRLREPWLESPAATRLAMGLFVQGRLTEAAATAREGEVAARQVGHAADLSLLRAHDAVSALAGGRLGEVDDAVADALRFARRSRYPWAAPFAAGTQAAAHALRGAWADATSSLDRLTARGDLFEDPPPAARIMAAVYRELLASLAPNSAADPQRVASLASFARLAGRDTAVLSPICALVEVMGRLGQPGIAEPLVETIELAAERGVVLTQGWVFLLPRILAKTSLLARRIDEACLRFERAIEAARALRLVPELAAALVDAAEAWGLRGAEGDRRRALEALTEAEALHRGLRASPPTL
jgi:hypothetical protein